MRSTRLTAAAVGAFLMLSGASAQAPSAEAVAACERAAQRSLAPQAAAAADVRLTATPTINPGLSNDSQVVLHGAGSWRSADGPRRFDYTCNVDLKTSEAVGFVLRDTTPAAAVAKPARPAIEPDLSHLSPVACESSAAAALQKRWPRVSQISFDSNTRTLRQDSASKAELHGRGRAMPAPGAPFSLFGFDCEIDPRDGRVLGTRVSG